MENIAPSVDSDVEEEVVGVEKNPRIGMIVGLIVGVALLIGCICGVGLLLGGIVKFGNSVEKIIEEDVEIVEEEEDEVVKPAVSDKNYIGDSDFGYLEVDETWSNYEDEEESGMLRYSSGLYLISLYAVPKLQASSEDYQTNVLKALEEDGVENATSEVSKLGDYDAYKISGYYADRNMHLVIWIFEAEDNKTHYVSVEGLDESNEKFEIPAKFSLKKED
ncbi:MAG: hypothetical protein MJ155_00310 [Candidatus Saccharibacteria bacterium]|nr:hypothetical protein [Candidatus Saccharibacteria bacterium]